VLTASIEPHSTTILARIGAERHGLGPTPVVGLHLPDTARLLAGRPTEAGRTGRAGIRPVRARGNQAG